MRTHIAAGDYRARIDDFQYPNNNERFHISLPLSTGSRIFVAIAASR